MATGCEPSGGDGPEPNLPRDPLPLATFQPVGQFFRPTYPTNSPFPSYRLLFTDRRETCETAGMQHLGPSPATIDVSLPRLGPGQFPIGVDNPSDLTAQAYARPAAGDGAEGEVVAAGSGGIVEIDSVNTTHISGAIDIVFTSNPRFPVFVQWEERNGNEYYIVCDCVQVDGTIASFETDRHDVDCCNQDPVMTKASFDFSATRCPSVDRCEAAVCPEPWTGSELDPDTICPAACGNYHLRSRSCWLWESETSPAPSQTELDECLVRCRTEFGQPEVQTAIHCLATHQDCDELALCLDRRRRRL